MRYPRGRASDARLRRHMPITVNVMVDRKILAFLLGLLTVSSISFADSWNASGGTKYTIVDGGFNYTVHTFTSSGTLYTNGTINATVLVVAGGGGGGGTIGGGGGSGGLLYNTSYIITGNVSVTVGDGGAGATGNAVGSTGQDSVFGTMTAKGGGGGACHVCTANAGGSGGGAGGAYTTGGSSPTGGAASPAGQGYSGGNNTGGASYDNTGAGGGGSSVMGGNTNSVSGNAGNGGNGLNFSINGSNVYYAGGGGGGIRGASGLTNGSGGLGGGAPGAITGVGTAASGTANTGGGGGGGQSGTAPEAGGAGGSGIVIVRYLTTGSAVYTINVSSPLNNSASANGNITFNLTTNLPDANITVNGTNYTMNCTGNYTCVKVLSLADSTYNWQAFAYNASNLTQNATAGTYYFTIDSSVPTNVAFNLPNNALVYLNNVSFNLSYNASTFGNCTVFINGTGYNMTNVSSTACEYNTSGLYGNLTYYGQVCTVSGLCQTSSTASVLVTNFSITPLEPLSGAVLIEPQITARYNATALIAPISCFAYVNNVLADSRVVASGGDIQTFIYPVTNGANTWYVNCYPYGNPVANYSTGSISFTASYTSLNSSYQVSLYPENVYVNPQSLFYDINGNLNIFYYTSTNGSTNAEIKTLNGSTVTNTWAIKNNLTDEFISVFRLSNSTLILTFDAATNTSANFISVNGGISKAAYTTEFNARSNTYYDPYSYANTKRYSTISIVDSSRYLFWIQNNTTSAILVSMNASLNSSNVSNLTMINSTTAPISWQTLANKSDLTNWYYAIPFATTAGNYTIRIYNWNGTHANFVAAPDSRNYSASQIGASKVIFEAYDNQTYFMDANVSNTTIYSISKNLSFLLNYSISNPSNFYFVDDSTLVFFSTESGVTYTYSCYFGAAANCTRISANDYGTTVPYLQGAMTTAKRVNGNDIVTTGFTTGGSSPTSNLTTLYYTTYTYDMKYACYDEVSLARKAFNVRVYSDANSSVMAAGVYLYGYVFPSSILGATPGDINVFSLCTPVGTSRMYVVDGGPTTFSQYSLNSSVGIYDTFYVTNCYGSAVPNAIITAYRYITGHGWTIVEQTKTSINGDGYLFLEPGTPYQIVGTSDQGNTVTTTLTPTTATTVSVALACTGQNNTANANYNSIYEDLSFYINPPDGTMSNTSMNITFFALSKNSRIVSTNALVYRTPQYSNETILIVNTTSTNRSGFSYVLPVTASSGAATYYAKMFVVVVNYPINNSNGSYNLSDYSAFYATAVADPTYTLAQYTAAIQGVIDALSSGRAIGPGVWFFLAGAAAILSVGYVSRYTIDGAGLIGSAVLLAFGLVYNATLVIGGVGISLVFFGAASIFVVIAVMFWRRG